MSRRAAWVVFGGLVASVWAVGACSTGGVEGTIVCTNKTDVSVDSACTLSFGNCQDGHSYSVECVNDVCQCFTDTSAKMVQGLSDCPGGANEMNEDCGFSVKE